MQKKIIALAIAAAFAAPAVAMADVTMYGSMDGGLRHQINATDAAHGGGTTDTMQMGQYNTARFGFKGVDDMGDGTKATVILETSLAPGGVGSSTVMTSGANASSQATVNPNNGFGLLFDRQATLGLEGGYGALVLGWNYSAAFKTVTSFDPMEGKFLAVTGVAAMNLYARSGIAEYSNGFGDVKVTAQYKVANADKSTQPSQGTGRALAVNYTSGPINAAASYTADEGTAGLTPAQGAHEGKTHIAVGAGFKMDDVKISAGYAKETDKALAANPTYSDGTTTNMFVGAKYSMSPKLAVAAAYYSKVTNGGAPTESDRTTKPLIVGVTYAMSKATTVYFEMDKTTVSQTGTDDAITNGTALGLATAF